MERYILAVAVGSDEPTNQFCFDCSTETFLNPEIVAIWFVFSMLIASPAVFFGIVIHRKLHRLPMVVRALLVGVSVCVLWSIVYGAAWISLNAEVFLSGSLMAAAISYFDGARVDAARAATRFSDY
ncbi:hypothetical protein [Paraurantiacibacter namhicola]|uniref:hypothetical protein n=1 Tax=Paraurantiacibacter namhicola TaxID=645517 RepID=UPI0012EE630A|nr:hypothetical protein [Paraurantiacibacter namhicola]